MQENRHPSVAADARKTPMTPKRGKAIQVAIDKKGHKTARDEAFKGRVMRTVAGKHGKS